MGTTTPNSINSIEGSIETPTQSQLVAWETFGIKTPTLVRESLMSAKTPGEKDEMLLKLTRAEKVRFETPSSPTQIAVYKEFK